GRGYQGKDEGYKLVWGALVFGLIGASVTTFAVAHMRNTLDRIYSQVWSRYQATLKNSSSSWSNFHEEARRRYQRRLQEELEEEIERIERIRRMQSVFNRERNKFKRRYDSWQQHGGSSEFHEQYQRNDWYWNEDTSFRDYGSHHFRDAPRASAAAHPLSHHYTVLGLDR
ncbi:hypothetical protein M569_05188, partial [Genlisea aurea]